MSLFIGLLAFPASAELQDQVKLGVLAGSLLSGAAGLLVLGLARGSGERKRDSTLAAGRSAISP